MMVRAPAHESLFEFDRRTGATIEVFRADRALEAFGWCGARGFWWARSRDYSALAATVHDAAHRHSLKA